MQKKFEFEDIALKNILQTLFRTNSRAFLLCLSLKMLGQKRKMASKSIIEKYKILEEVDKGNSSGFVAKNITSQSRRYQTGLKRKIYESVDSNPSVKRRRFRGSIYENIDEVLL